MKLFKRFLTGASVLALVSIFSVRTSNAQIWAYYDVVYQNQFFNPLVGNPITVLSDFDFRDFAGNIDRDDGVDNNVPVGFTFDYNSGLYSTVNVCVNGWASVGVQPTPVITHDKYYLFTVNQPNNTLAPFWGDHYYRTPTDISAGYTPSKIQYATTGVPDPNPNTNPGSLLRTFTIEWKDLNINDKNNVNSIATFQLKIVQNPMANDLTVPDQRATIQFHYGPIGNNGFVKTQGATVGIEDSVSDSLAHSFMNAIFPSSFAGEDSTRRNKDSLTTCWPPAGCLPGRIIAFEPQGRGSFAQWGDGDFNLTQIDPSAPANIRTAQNRFVTLADADLLLQGVARAYPAIDSLEGRAAFHGDANHTGRYQNPLYPGFNFYRVTAYDAAYILMYLAAKLPFLPWTGQLPVYKEMNSDATNISGLFADTRNTSMRGNTTLVPIVLRGTVNGAIAFDLNVKIANSGLLQLVGAESSKGLMQNNAQTGKIVFAAAGKFSDGEILGYLQFNEEKNAVVDFDLTDVTINDESYASSRSTLDVGAGQSAVVSGNALEQNSPNPFALSTSSLTTIRYNLKAASVVTLKIYDMLGAEIRSLASSASVGAGSHQVQWDGRDNNGSMVSSGAYYYQITTPDFTQTVKMSVIR